MLSFLPAMRLLYDEKKTQASASGEVFAATREIVAQLTTLGMDSKLAILPSIVCVISAEKTKAVVNMRSAQPPE